MQFVAPYQLSKQGLGSEQKGRGKDAAVGQNCCANGKCIVAFLPSRFGIQEGTAIQMGCTAVENGGVLQYFLDKLYGLGAPRHSPKPSAACRFSGPGKWCRLQR